MPGRRQPSEKKRKENKKRLNNNNDRDLSGAADDTHFSLLKGWDKL